MRRRVPSVRAAINRLFDMGGTIRIPEAYYCRGTCPRRERGVRLALDLLLTPIRSVEP